MRLSRIALALGALVSTPAASHAEPEDPEACTRVRGRAVYRGFGYEHIVEVENGCTKRVRCLVWTDVDPAPKHSLRVRSGETGSVTTRRGSPARAFAAEGECHFE